MEMTSCKPKIPKNGIVVSCPICKKVKKIAILEEIIGEEIGCLFPIEIKRGTVCDHDFTAMVDQNFSVRDYCTPKQKKQHR